MQVKSLYLFIDQFDAEKLLSFVQIFNLPHLEFFICFVARHSLRAQIFEISQVTGLSVYKLELEHIYLSSVCQYAKEPFLARNRGGELYWVFLNFSFCNFCSIHC